MPLLWSGGGKFASAATNISLLTERKSGHQPTEEKCTTEPGFYFSSALKTNGNVA